MFFGVKRVACGQKRHRAGRRRPDWGIRGHSEITTSALSFSREILYYILHELTLTHSLSHTHIFHTQVIYFLKAIGRAAGACCSSLYILRVSVEPHPSLW
jgi:hypothetical protein